MDSEKVSVISPSRPMHVMLIHGMGRSPASMILLGARLQHAGYVPHYFGYFAGFESYAAIANRLTQRLNVIGQRNRYIVVAHSLGGLLARSAVGGLPSQARRPAQLYQLGSPNQSPRLARRLHQNWAFHRFHGDCGRLLASPERMASIPLIDTPIMTIAGTMGIYGPSSPFGDDPNDGIVAVNETTLAGATRVEMNLTHAFMMMSPRVAKLIIRQTQRSG